MSSNNSSGGASRHYGGLVFIASVLLAGVLLVGVLCSPSEPETNRCPHSPQPGPIDEFDPWFRIISPNDGEVFYVGEQCTVKVRSRFPVPSAMLYVSVGEEYYLTPPSMLPVMGASLPGDSAAGAYGDSTVIATIFTVPDSFSQFGGGNVYGVSEECLIAIHPYTTAEYSDTSDCYFSIRNP